MLYLFDTKTCKWYSNKIDSIFWETDFITYTQYWPRHDVMVEFETLYYPVVNRYKTIRGTDTFVVSRGTRVLVNGCHHVSVVTSEQFNYPLILLHRHHFLSIRWGRWGRCDGSEVSGSEWHINTPTDTEFYYCQHRNQ